MTAPVASPPSAQAQSSSIAMAGGALVSAVTSDRITIANRFIGFTFSLQRHAL